jgi:hypothetical protein
LSFLPGNARIHSAIWFKVGAPVTKDWGSAVSVLPPA